MKCLKSSDITEFQNDLYLKKNVTGNVWNLKRIMKYTTQKGLESLPIQCFI